jgi:hypothetical protein
MERAEHAEQAEQMEMFNVVMQQVRQTLGGVAMQARLRMLQTPHQLPTTAGTAARKHAHLCSDTLLQALLPLTGA